MFNPFGLIADGNIHIFFHLIEDTAAQLDPIVKVMLMLSYPAKTATLLTSIAVKIQHTICYM